MEGGAGKGSRMFYWKFPYIQFFLFNPLKNNIYVFPTDENLEKIRTPLMILHSEDDHIVPIASAKEIYRIAKKAQNSDERVKLVSFNGSLGYLHNGLYKDPGFPDIIRSQEQWTWTKMGLFLCILSASMLILLHVFSDPIDLSRPSDIGLNHTINIYLTPEEGFYWKFPYIQYFLFNPLKNQDLNLPNDENLQKLRTPLMILHAEDDHLVPFAVAQENYRIAKKAQNSDERVKLVRFDGSLGYLHNGLYRDPSLPDIISFKMAVTSLLIGRNLSLHHVKFVSMNTHVVWFYILLSSRPFHHFCLRSDDVAMGGKAYTDKEEVVLWMNTVGPYHNRQETYKYFSLPFCVGTKKTISHYHETLGEALQGVELEFSGLDIKFKDEVMQTTYCDIELDKPKRDAFVYAIKNHYWYQMYIDDLPIWGIVGEADENGEDYYLWTYKKLEIGHNGNRIVDVNLTSEGKVKLVPNTRIPMSYSVKWKKSDVKFEDRFDKYLDPSFFQHRIHWFSIFNSFMMVIFLVGLVSMILMRTLRKDYARYSKEEEMDDMDRDLGDEYGWKQVHGDVFRPSSHPLIFSSLIGSGCQIFSVSLIVIVLAMIEDLYTERGSMLSTAIFVYAATSPVNGYFGGSLYAKQGGRRWIKQMFIGAFLIPAMVCGTAFFINFIAIYYHASRAIPFGTMVAVCCICFFVILPLNLVGTILGRNLSGQPNFPCRVNAVPRPIPEKKWFMEPAVIVCLGGILPFGSIFIEMYFIFTSFWAYKIYYVYGFMMLVLVILCIVTVCVTIVCTYFLLNAEDYRWQWTSFLSAASTAVYVYMYSFYYYFFKTKMYGLFQTSFYFGYMAVFSTALGIMCGAVGYMGTSAFVRKIYTNVKID
ncbi:transmembrane 9 superfamily member 3 [Labeo rohita]|uniref:Transmembrane 9 superfamily member n=1 Tax=Labeo rohita TaxID=84645 RepID=A0A498NE11_LABRO|nr:transmembrane 9 superfamily member 3 [Labeo rohita]